MKPKSLLLASLFIAFTGIAKAQEIASINVAASTKKSFITSVDIYQGDVLISVDMHGRTALRSLHGNNISYYDSFDGPYLDGKIKSIGGLTINYYDEFDDHDKVGKLKSVGNVQINYYDEFDGADNIGKLKSIGRIGFSYYDRFDQTNIGQLKAVGPNRITYYDQFDGSDNIGKLKTIGGTTFRYYDSFDINSPKGKIKSVSGNSPIVNVMTMD